MEEVTRPSREPPAAGESPLLDLRIAVEWSALTMERTAAYLDDLDQHPDQAPDSVAQILRSNAGELRESFDTFMAWATREE